MWTRPLFFLISQREAVRGGVDHALSNPARLQCAAYACSAQPIAKRRFLNGHRGSVVRSNLFCVKLLGLIRKNRSAFAFSTAPALAVAYRNAFRNIVSILEAGRDSDRIISEDGRPMLSRSYTNGNIPLVTVILPVAKFILVVKNFCTRYIFAKVES